jgi:hypothetical protein
LLCLELVKAAKFGIPKTTVFDTTQHGRLLGSSELDEAGVLRGTPLRLLVASKLIRDNPIALRLL